MGSSPQMQADSSPAEIAAPELTFRSADRAKLRLASNPALKEGLHYLNAEDYPVWDALVDASPQGSVFCYSWWLRAVDPGIRVLGYFEKGRLVAGMPVLRKRRWGVWLCGMPKFTPFWGLVMEPLSGKRVTIASREMELLRVFAWSLKDERFFFHDFHPTVKNWLPFYWNGFSQTSRCSYLIENPSNLSDRLRTSAGIFRRTNGQAAAGLQNGKSGMIEEPTAASSIENNSGGPLPAGRLRFVLDAARQHCVAECFTAVDTRGRALATGALVWDNKRAYYLYCCERPGSQSSDLYLTLASYSLLFTSGRFAGISFGMPMPETAERLLLDAGARQVLYNRIFKFPWWSGGLLAKLVTPR